MCKISIPVTVPQIHYGFRIAWARFLAFLSASCFAHHVVGAGESAKAFAESLTSHGAVAVTAVFTLLQFSWCGMELYAFAAFMAHAHEIALQRALVVR